MALFGLWQDLGQFREIGDLLTHFSLHYNRWGLWQRLKTPGGVPTDWFVGWHHPDDFS